MDNDRYLRDLWAVRKDGVLVYPYRVERGNKSGLFDVSWTGKTDEFMGVTADELVSRMRAGAFAERGTVRMLPLNPTPGEARNAYAPVYYQGQRIRDLFPSGTPMEHPSNDAFERGYQVIKASFLAIHPTFTTFAACAENEARERDYKVELVQLFDVTVRPLLQAGDWIAAGDAAISMLSKPLIHGERQPQNIVGWRYVGVLRELDADGRGQLARLLLALIDEGSDLASRVDAFLDALRQVTEPKTRLMPAAQRSIVGFFLAVSDPARHIFLKTREMKRALPRLDPSFGWTSGRLTGADVVLVEQLALRLRDRLARDGYEPRDFIDVQSFLWVATAYGQDDQDEIDEVDVTPTVAPAALPQSTSQPPLNQILFGPPGTGKTYSSITKALEILDPECLPSRKGESPEAHRTRVKGRYDALAEEGLIQFVTFHQSFSYEDFVEGIRAETDEDGGAVRYSVEDGIFKRLCDAARARVVRVADAALDVTSRRIWKLSLGDYVTQPHIFTECIDRGLALMGFGAGADFSQCATREDIVGVFAKTGDNVSSSDYAVTAINTFVLQMKPGDLVVVTEGNLKFRAIGEITSGYRWVEREGADTYTQGRDVRWLRVYEPALPYTQLMANRFSQMTVYELRKGSIELEKLKVLLEPSGTSVPARPRVLVVDEINRGNVSRIFGELITLIEPSKRAGAPEALKTVLPYSKSPFSVPSNVYLIGTMNTADRSLAGLDIALRRRFDFVEMPPNPGALIGIDVEGLPMADLLSVINQRVELLLDRDHQIGHTYFLPLREEPTVARLAAIFKNQILPLLQEYFFEDWQRIAWVLNDHRKGEKHQFVQQSSCDARTLLGDGPDIAVESRLWRINQNAFGQLRSYEEILAGTSD